MKLESALTPIRSGVTPSSGGGLSQPRAAQLQRDLATLADARRRAWVEYREFAVLT